MTLDEAMEELKVVLGFRSDLATTGPAALKKAQENYERGPVYPWFLLSENSFTQTSDTDRRVQLPSDFIAEYEEGALFYDSQEDDESWEQLYKYDYDYLVKKYGTVAVGEPQTYSFDGKYFNIFPKPDALYKLWMKYYQHDISISSLSGSDTNLWLTNAPDCIIGRAGGILAAGYRDNVATMKFKDLENEAKAVLNIQNEDRKHSNRIYQVGGAH
jgi:hypothetical protein